MLTAIPGETPSILTNIPNVGQQAQVIPMPIPAPEVNHGAALGNNAVPVRGFVAALNKYDADDDSDFKTWYFTDEDITDLNPFVGADHEYSDLFGINFKKIGGFLSRMGKGAVENFTPFGRFIFKHSKFTGDDEMESFVGVTISEVSPAMQAILERAAASRVLHVPARLTANVWYRDHLAATDSSFDGDDYDDYDGIDIADLKAHQAFFNGLSPDEQDEYSDLFGINFKKIGQAIGKAVKGVGKAVGSAGKFVGKTVGTVAKGVGKGALAVGKLGVKVVKGGLKIAAAASGLGDIFGASTDQSNGGTLPANWGAGAGTANADFDPQMYAPEAYDPNDGDNNPYGTQIDDLADQGYTPTEDELTNGATALPYPPVEPHSNLWLWIALAAFLGIGFYLIHTKKIKI